MNDEVRDMIGHALDGEPPLSLDYAAVLAAGRRRLARRNLGIAGTAVLSVVTVAALAATAGQFAASPANLPSGPPPSTGTTLPAPPTVTTLPASAVPWESNCPFSNQYNGVPNPPSTPPTDVGSPEQRAEADRLTAAFGKVTVPLPAAVTMDPAKPLFCFSVDTMMTEFTLHTPAGDRGVLIEARWWPERTRATGPCDTRGGLVTCRQHPLPGGGTADIGVTAPVKRTDPTIVEVHARRADGTYVTLIETGREGPRPTPRVLADDALLAIVGAPELKVDIAAADRPPLPSSVPIR
jgi:hypothetical protein